MDNDGFLWVATDNGVSRFDGKRFINYTSKNGLPSNDVIQIIRQNDGTIWANCYKQPPSYFDVKRNRFVCLEYDKFIVEMSNDLLNVVYPINKNDLFFKNNYGSFIFSNGKITRKIKYSEAEKIDNNTSFYFKNELINLKINQKTVGSDNFFTGTLFQKNKILGSIKYVISNQFIATYYNNSNIYYFSNNEITRIKINNLKPLKYEIITAKISGTIKWYRFSDNKLSVTCTDGMVSIFDLKNLKFISKIITNYNVNTAYVDRQNNIWMSTLNDGLMYYTKQTIKQENYSSDVISNFLCAKISETGELFAGNYQGEIYKKNGVKESKYNFSRLKENNLWIRNIHFFPQKTIVVSDDGILVNFNKKITFYSDVNEKLNVKSSSKLNDDELILGNIQGLIKFNVLTEKYEVLNFPKERILNIKKINDTSFYFSANEGLYKYDLIAKNYKLVIANKLFKNDKIQYFETISDSKIWISTYKGNLYLIENQNIKKQFINDKRIPINISKLLNINNQLWIASKSGIFIINFQDLQNISILKLTTADGLSSNAINFLDYKKDTVYAATDNGISKIPFQTTNTEHYIKPQLVAIKINGKNTAQSTYYKLKSDENNIALELAGVDITGHFKNFQYAINGNNFTDINGNFLNLQLNSGKNEIKIRVVDENNEIHQNAIKLNFEIEMPYYKTIWFWAIISILVTAWLFYYFNQKKLIIQKRKFLQRLEIERERNKITSDLHDDLGASLSSLQINSAIAQKLFDKNPTEAKKILKKIEFQAKNIAENIGDIIWSLKPTKDEFMSLSTRIKKITSEILGSSQINYKIAIDENINERIIDFSARKNIILIIKECLNNILKHSKANKVNLIIKKIEDKFLIEISDNGIGFIGCETKGNGLANIKKRAKELGGKLEIISENGTTVKIVVPIFRDV